METTIEDLSNLLNVSKPTIERDLSYLKKQNKVKYIGSSKSGKWVVLK